MKHFSILLFLSLFIACNSSQKKDAQNVPDSNSENIEKVKKETKSVSLADYSSILVDYKCEMTPNEISKILKIPVTDIEMPSNQNNGKKCVIRYSRNGTYYSNLTWGNVPATIKGNQKAIAKAIKDKKDDVSILGSDMVLSETGDCYLIRTPINGRITIRNANYDSAFQLFYGSRGKRTKEEHEEMKVKFTNLANHLLKTLRK